MVPSVTSTPPSEKILAELLAELAGRVEAGEAVDVEELARAHPDMAGPIRRMLPAVEVLVGIGRPAGGDPATSPADPTVLGDFRILREVGRGGMGIVYEAEQITLGRRVALKVLPTAAALDPRQLQRFKIEALAAAHLHHTHIVPVFSVGCEGGVHYYAMQFIAGRTLADLIGAMRRREALDPTEPMTPEGDAAAAGHHRLPEPTEGWPPARSRAFYRAVAELGLRAAEALDHAHGLGVLHRDIKPANLLVDASSHLWVADFGLARLQSDSGLTLTGDLMGTLRYMSPEQAAGRPAEVDARSDIYSLGATLYELLTLRPAFDGEGRPELLRQILQEEPRPPRRLDPGLPRDLATIVMKAMAKSPSDRYASARELAGDLRRYLENRPIQARRPSPWQRAAKWSRRNQPVVWSAAAVLALAVVVLAASNVQIRREERAKELALRQKDSALTEREAALARARTIADLFQEMLTSARAKGTNYTVRELLDEFVGRLDRGLEGQPETEAAIRRAFGVAYRRLGLPEKAAPHLESALRLRRTAFGDGHELVAESLLDLAWNLAAAGDLAGAEDRVREALAILRLSRDRPRPLLQALWASVWLQIYQGRHAEAEATGREALELARTHPGAEPPEVANILHALADSRNDRGQFAQAEPLAREAVALHRRLHGEAHPETGWGWNALARAMLGQARYAESEEAYRRALAIFTEQYPEGHKSVAQARRGLVSALMARGDQAGLEEALRPVLADATRALERDPDDPEAWLRRSLMLADWNQWDRAADDGEQAFRRRERLAPASRAKLADLYLRRALRPDTARRPEVTEKAVAILDRLVADDPADREQRGRLAQALGRLGQALAAVGRDGEAEAALRRAIELLRSAAAEFPNRPGYRAHLMQSYSELARSILRRATAGDSQALEEAAEVVRKAVDACPEDPRAWNNLAWALVRDPAPRSSVTDVAVELAEKAVRQKPVGHIWNTLGVAHYRAGNWDQAIRALDQAVERMGDVGFGHNALFLAMAYWRRGDEELGRQWFERALRWVEAHPSDDEELRRARAEAEALLYSAASHGA